MNPAIMSKGKRFLMNVIVYNIFDKYIRIDQGQRGDRVKTYLCGYLVDVAVGLECLWVLFDLLDHISQRLRTLKMNKKLFQDITSDSSRVLNTNNTYGLFD